MTEEGKKKKLKVWYCPPPIGKSQMRNILKIWKARMPTVPFQKKHKPD